MQVQKQRLDPVRLLWRRITLVLLTGVAVLGSIGVYHVYEKEKISRTLRDQAESHLAELSKHESALQKDIATLQTARGREAILRTEYALGAPGEQQVLIIDGPAPATPIVASSTKKSWIRNIFRWW